MKTQIFKRGATLLLALIAAGAILSLRAQDARKEYSENFQVRQGVTLTADTRYSDIEILTWDRNEVDIFAEVEVDAGSKNRAEAALARVEIGIEQSGNTIYLETEFQDGWSRNVDTEIRITVKSPAYLNLDMENSYGDLFIQQLDGLVLLELKYSNLKAGNLSRGNEKPLSSLELAYSNCTIEEAGWLEMEIAYTDVEILRSDRIFMESKYSKLIGEQFGGVETEGAYDKYYLDQVGYFSAELKYSGIKFGELGRRLTLEAAYTNVNIDQLSAGFDEVDASLSYGNFNMGVEPGTSYKFQGEAKYGKVKVVRGDQLSRSQDGSYMKMWGSVGNNPRSTLQVVTRYGNIQIQ